mmetsp:Transcript_6860/g.12957  ORF Transcript_6860/g.12957 Transcript_6860/m.12957 type:complete len:262 (-) Transcript_6860:72-857(-)
MTKFLSKILKKSPREAQIQVLEDPTAPRMGHTNRRRRMQATVGQPETYEAKQQRKHELDPGFYSPAMITQSQCVMLDKTDSATGVRQEWMLLEYDALYDPLVCFHMELKWLVASGSTIDTWITKHFTRTMKSFEILIFPIPASQPVRTSNAFNSSVMKIPLSSEHQRSIALEYLQNQCGFVLEYYHYSNRRHYIHHTGMCVVREVSEGLVWIANTLSEVPADDSKKAYHEFLTFLQKILDVQVLVSTIITRAIEHCQVVTQ